jgi:hypothetical protein
MVTGVRVSVTYRNSREGEKRMTIRVVYGGGKLLIAEEERQRRSWRDDEDGRHPHCHRAAWRPREDDDLFSLIQNGI